MNILYICPNFDNNIYSYYGLIINGLKQLGHNITPVKYLDLNILNNYDVIIFGYRGFNKNLYGKKINTNTKMYNLLGAQSSQEFKEKGITLNENNIINLCTMCRINHLTQNYFKNIIPFNYSFYPDIFKDYNKEKIYDIGMTGAAHEASKYPDDSFTTGEKNNRIRLYKLLDSMKDKYNIFKKCNDDISKGRIISDIEYAETINSSKIWISCSAAYGDCCRHFQVPSCKTLLFCNEPSESYPFETIFKNNENCVFFKNDLSDFKEKVDYYLTNEDEYNRIVNNGYKEFHEKHTNVQRAKELIKIIES
jgi:hypothetical protein